MYQVNNFKNKISSILIFLESGKNSVI